jgi:peptidoglycan/xylan/chitin deacetylase (PgdA/CDA1 family)
MSAVTLPAGWPAGKTLAISVSVMLEGWTDDSAPGVGPMGNVLKAGVLDWQARSWAEYGPRVGAWRILDILAEAGVAAVFYVSGVLADRYPALMRAIADAGHSVAGHSWGQNIIPATQTPEDEARDLDRCVTILTETTGAAPLGWLSPRCTPSKHTTSLLAGRGFGWHADFFDSDLPRIETTRFGPIVAVPFTMEVNDMPLSVRYGQEPDAFPRILEKIVAGWPRLGNRPGCIDVTVHAHVFGRPAGALAFIDALNVAKQYADWAWLTDHASLAALWRTA